MVERLIIRISLFCILLAGGCVEHFSFDTENELPAVVIEGYISDVSSDQYASEFDTPRYFEISLKWASRVKNVRDENVTGAEIELYSKNGNEYWDYSEQGDGKYLLLYGDFKAVEGHEYQLQITLPDGNEIVSDFEVTPEPALTGEIDFREVSEFQYVYEGTEEVIKELAGVDVEIAMQPSAIVDKKYIRWSFLTTWILRAVRIPPSSPGGLCWVTEKYFLDEYQLAEYAGSALEKKLFFLQTHGNLPIEDGFSVRVNQVSMSKNYYQFWEDLDDQKKQADLFAPPPYNLTSNLSSESSDFEVYGYFGVVSEHNYTWYFDLTELSYVPQFVEPCYAEFANDRPAYCNNCMSYEALKYGDVITNNKPNWWIF